MSYYEENYLYPSQTQYNCLIKNWNNSFNFIKFKLELYNW